MAAGELPSGARSFVLALEQEEARSLYAHPVSAEPLRLAFPATFSDSQPVTLTRLALGESLRDLGLAASGPLPASPEPRRSLSTLTPLAVETASVFSTESVSPFREGTASDWILEHPIPRLDRCVARARDEVIVDTRPPRDMLLVRPDFAVGVSLDGWHLFDAEGLILSIAAEAGEDGRSVGLGLGGRIWIATSSRAGVLDEATGALTEQVSLPPGTVPIGVGEDPARGDLYVFSATDEATLWRRVSGEPRFERLYTVPGTRVRIEGLQKQIARFFYPASGRVAVAIDDVSALLEVDGDDVNLVETDPVGSGFSAVLIEENGRVLLAESALGGLYEYQPGRLDRIAQITTKVIAMAPLGSGRYAYVTAPGLLGTFDLRLGESCSEVPIGAWSGGSALLRMGDRLLAAGNVGPFQWGFRWLALDY